MNSFYSNGKLLLTGEYLVLDGAVALAVPSVYGQSLDIEKGKVGKIKWTSLNENGTVWFEAEYQLSKNEILIQAHNDDPISDRLLQILKAAKQLNPDFLKANEGYHLTTSLGFPKNWGLGTSSTLISNIADWANVDPYLLLEATFGGSGYDIACARANKSLTYQLKTDNKREIKTVNFNPPFSEHIYFVHLNQKQNSRDGIEQYRTHKTNISSYVLEVNTITKQMISCDTLQEFRQLMEDHERLVSRIIKQTPVKKALFNDFKGSIKSLGAWGGDFVMVATDENPTTYFASKGYRTILSYSEMVKN